MLNTLLFNQLTMYILNKRNKIKFEVTSQNPAETRKVENKFKILTGGRLTLAVICR